MLNNIDYLVALIVILLVVAFIYWRTTAIAKASNLMQNVNIQEL